MLCSVNLYTYYRCSLLGNLNFVLRIPVKLEDLLKAIQQIYAVLPVYSTRVMRSTFYDKYQSVASIKPVVLRDMFRYLTNDSSAAEYSAQAKIDDRLLRILADAELLIDMSKKGGNTGNTKFETFWNEVEQYFSVVNPAVHERRHSEGLYLPFAISLGDLRSEVMKRISVGIPVAVPSVEW